MNSNVIQMAPWRAWLLASRPRTLTAAIVPVVVGTALSSGNWEIALFSLLAAICIQIGTNLINDAADFKRGADTEERLGFMRVTQAKLLSYSQVFATGIAFFAVAALLGLPLILQGGWIIGTILAVSILCGYFYTSGPLPLAYHGLGELFVLLFFGWISTEAIFYLNNNEFSVLAFLAGSQIGLLATAIIAINNLRDHKQDAKANKKTLAVRFGITFGRAEITFCLFIPFVLNIFWFFVDKPLAGLLPFLTLPLASKVVWQIWKIAPSREYNQLFVKVAALHLLFGVLLALGLL